jgi:hypothetical protein
MDEPNNAEFNSVINDILHNALGRNILAEIESGSIDNLPVDFELVTDFHSSAYNIICNKPPKN